MRDTRQIRPFQVLWRVEIHSPDGTIAVSGDHPYLSAARAHAAQYLGAHAPGPDRIYWRELFLGTSPHGERGDGIPELAIREVREDLHCERCGAFAVVCNKGTVCPTHGELTELLIWPS